MNSPSFKYSIIILASILSSCISAPQKKYHQISTDESMGISSMDGDQSGLSGSSGTGISINRQNNRVSGGDASGHGRRHGWMLGTSMSTSIAHGMGHHHAINRGHNGGMRETTGYYSGENNGRGSHLHHTGSGTGTGMMISENSNGMGSHTNVNNGMGMPMGPSTGLSHQVASTSMSSGTNFNSGTRTSSGNRNDFKNGVGMSAGSSNTYQTGMGMTDSNARTFAETHYWNAELGKFMPIIPLQNPETKTGSSSSISTQSGTSINHKLELSQTASSGSHGA